MKQESVKVINLNKRYGKKIVTNNINVTFHRGQIIAIVGHNGAGKTTLLNQINGVVSSDEGAVYIDGQNISKDPRLARELVSSMPQFQAPIKGVTLQEAITCIGQLKGMTLADVNYRAKQLIDYLDIDKWKMTPGEKLSGGLQRLTSFAMSVIDEPSIVVLDEPTNDVDPYRRLLIWRYLRLLANKGSTVIVVSHNLFEVERYADRYLLLENGNLIKDVDVSAIQKNQDSQHLVSIIGIEEQELQQFSDIISLKYDDMEKRLVIAAEKDQLAGIMSTILTLLHEGKIISYELKLKNLSDEYEEYLGDE